MSDQIFPDTFLGMRITAITRRRIDNFKRNRRGYISSVFFYGSVFYQPICRTDCQR